MPVWLVKLLETKGDLRASGKDISRDSSYE